MLAPPDPAVLTEKPASGYSAKDIEVLEGREPVRKRPGMYIGGTDERALHHLFAEVLDNAMDEAVAGHAKVIEVKLDADGVLSVKDDGRGIPVDPHPKHPGKSALEVIMTVLHSGGKFSGKAYETSGGLHGVGVSVVNALSERVDVTAWKDGFEWRQSFSRGKPLGFSVSTAGSGRGSWLCASGAAGAGFRASSKREAWGVEAWDMRPENGTIRDRPI